MIAAPNEPPQQIKPSSQMQIAMLSLRCEELASAVRSLERKLSWCYAAIVFLFIAVVLLASEVNGQITPPVAYRLANDLQPGRSIRYVYCVRPGKSTWAAVSLAANTISRSATAYTPTEAFGGAIIRINLAGICDTFDELKEMIALWEGLAAADPYAHPGGVVAPYVDGPDYAALSKATGSVCPIVPAEVLLVDWVTQIDGGRYYEWAGIAGKSHDEWLASIGADHGLSVAGNVQERAVVLSRITDNLRRLDVFYGRSVRPSVGLPLVTVTRDVRKTVEADPLANPLRSPITFRLEASEHINVKANGFLDYALYEATGKLQDSVPDAIARDDTAHPRDARLQPALSCIGCHGQHDGFQPFSDDAERPWSHLISRMRADGADLFGDVSATDAYDQAEVARKLQAMYGWRDDSLGLGKALIRARDDYNQAVMQACGGWTAQQASAALYGLVRGYQDHVDAEEALLWLGASPEFVWQADHAATNAVEHFRRVVPLLAPGPDGRVVDSPVVWALRSGERVTRKDFEQEFPNLMTRITSVN